LQKAAAHRVLPARKQLRLQGLELLLLPPQGLAVLQLGFDDGGALQCRGYHVLRIGILGCRGCRA